MPASANRPRNDALIGIIPELRQLRSDIKRRSHYWQRDQPQRNVGCGAASLCRLTTATRYSSQCANHTVLHLQVKRFEFEPSAARQA